MAPTGASAPQPLFELCLWDDRFSWEFLQTAEQLSHSSVMRRISLCMCVRVQLWGCKLCVRFSMCVSVCDWKCELRIYKSESWCKCNRGWGAHPCQSHMWLDEQILCIEGKTLTSVAAAHQKSPSEAGRLWEALPKVHHVICSVCLSPSASPTRTSSRLISPPCTPSPPLALLF